MKNGVKILLASVIALSIALISNDAFADSSSPTLDRIGQKGSLQGAIWCFSGTSTVPVGNTNRGYAYIKPDEDSDPQVRGELTIDSDYMPTRLMAPFYEAGEVIYLPNGLTPEAKSENPNAKTNCANLIGGGPITENGWSGDGFTDTIFDRFGKAKPDSGDSKMGDVMKSIGYSPSSGSGGGSSTAATERCFTITLNIIQYSDDRESPSMISQDPNVVMPFLYCAQLDSEGNIVDTTKQKTGDFDWSENFFNLENWGNGNNTGAYFAQLTMPCSNSGGAFLPLGWPEYDGYDSSGQNDLNTVNFIGAKFDAVLERLQTIGNAIASRDPDWNLYQNEYHGQWKGVDRSTCYSIEVDGIPQSITGVVSYIVGVTIAETTKDEEGNTATSALNWTLDRTTTAEKLTNYLTGKGLSYAALTDSERVMLYQYYINGIARLEVTCDDSTDKTGLTPVKWFETISPRKECWIKGEPGMVNTLFTKAEGNPFAAGVSTLGWFYDQVKITEIIDALNNININKLSGVTNAELEYMSALPTTASGETAEPSCFDNASGLGIVLCPIISASGAFVEDFYEDQIEPQLSLSPVLLNTNPNSDSYNAGVSSSVYGAWTIFQGFANIAFIAIFLFVILSQLTGFGLDNYGIKKVLPKLIMGAILINMSFIICQLAVDVANIAGGAIKGIFEQIGTIPGNVQLAEGGAGKAAAGISILVVIVGLIVAGAILTIGPAALIPVFMILITVVVAAISLFVMLAIRTSMAIILVVTAPLAFLCYILPNTKPIFNKWFGLFKAVLLAYPICSALVYGGQAVARITIIAMGPTSLPLSMALAAAAMSIAPIFAIPSTLKKSMAAINGMVGNVSQRLGNGLKKKVQNSGVASDWNKIRDLKKSGLALDKDGVPIVSKSGKLREKFALTKGSQRRLSAARGRAMNQALEDNFASTDFVGANADNALRVKYDEYKDAEHEKDIKRLMTSFKNQNLTPPQMRAKARAAKLAGKNDDEEAWLALMLTEGGEKGRNEARDYIDIDMAGASPAEKVRMAKMVQQWGGQAVRDKAADMDEWSKDMISSGGTATTKTSTANINIDKDFTADMYYRADGKTRQRINSFVAGKPLTAQQQFANLLVNAKTNNPSGISPNADADARALCLAAGVTTYPA